MWFLASISLFWPYIYRLLPGFPWIGFTLYQGHSGTGTGLRGTTNKERKAEKKRKKEKQRRKERKKDKKGRQKRKTKREGI